MQTITLKNNQSLVVRKLTNEDFSRLEDYLQQLSAATKKRFGPHPFDADAIQSFYSDDSHHGYIAADLSNTSIAAYAIIKKGYLPHDKDRLQSYGLTLSDTTDCTFAPCVSDHLQGHGLGSHLFQFILQHVEDQGYQRIILWGGVQASNDKAIQYYKKHGFTELGSFDYHGWNMDMAAAIRYKSLTHIVA